MLDKKIRASVAHVLLALINVDNVIDQGEIVEFAKLKTKYGIIPDDVLFADTMTFAEAVSNLMEHAKAKEDPQFLRKIYDDAREMTVSDGLCVQCEARLLYALKSVFFNNAGTKEDTGIRLFSCQKKAIQLDGPQVFFIREDKHTELSKNYLDYFQEYYYEFLNFGFELTNVVHITKELLAMGEQNIVELLNIGRPAMIASKASSIYQELSQLTPQKVFKEILDGTLDVVKDGITTYFLIKISESMVVNKGVSQIYYNFLRVPVVSDDGMKNVIRSVVKDFAECAGQINPIILPADFNKFRYYSFTKSLFKMLEAEVDRKEKGLKCLVIDAVNSKIELQGILKEGVHIQYKQLALYLLIAWLSSKGHLLVRTQPKSYELVKNDEHVSDLVKLADTKYAEIQQKIMKSMKFFDNPCSIMSQELGDLKTVLRKALMNEAAGKCAEICDLCLPFSDKRMLSESKDQKGSNIKLQLSGYVLKLPSSYIYVKVKGKKNLIPVGELFD